MRLIHPFCKIPDNYGLESLQRMNVISISKKKSSMKVSVSNTSPHLCINHR